MKKVGEFAQVIDYQVRLAAPGRGFDALGKQSQMPDQCLLVTVVETLEAGVGRRYLDAFFGAFAAHATDARVRVMHVVNRVVAALLARQVEVEIQVVVGLAHHVEKARRVAADIVSQLL